MYGPAPMTAGPRHWTKAAHRPPGRRVESGRGCADAIVGTSRHRAARMRVMAHLLVDAILAGRRMRDVSRRTECGIRRGIGESRAHRTSASCGKVDPVIRLERCAA